MKAQCFILMVNISGWLAAEWRHYTLTTQVTTRQSTWHNIPEDSSLLVGTIGIGAVLKSLSHLPSMTFMQLFSPNTILQSVLTP
jgi:hypothetical protein